MLHCNKVGAKIFGPLEFGHFTYASDDLKGRCVTAQGRAEGNALGRR
uniref:Uncharacterized protein n=1 Tax=uncultured bacterium contig00036 TaxID=1181524 RepID=A0A806KQF8_9BACT|nr:hypothetical protein [uncultured bacterium contig00036]